MEAEAMSRVGSMRTIKAWAIVDARGVPVKIDADNPSIWLHKSEAEHEYKFNDLKFDGCWIVPVEIRELKPKKPRRSHD